MKSLGWATLLIVVTSLTGYFLIPPQQELPPKSQVMLHPTPVPMLVLHDEEQDSKVKITHGFEHKHSFLVVKINHQFQFLHSLADLAPFDNDGDNIIDESDPIFGHLYLGHFDPKTKRIQYQPLQQSAIRAIKLLPEGDHQQKIAHAEVILSTHHQYSPHFHLMISQAYFKGV